MGGCAARIAIRNYYNGLTKDKIGEVLLQTGVYCGIATAEDIGIAETVV